MYVIIIIIISTVVQLSKKTWNHPFHLAIFYDLHESMIIALVTRGHVCQRAAWPGPGWPGGMPIFGPQLTSVAEPSAGWVTGLVAAPTHSAAASTSWGADTGLASLGRQGHGGLASVTVTCEEEPHNVDTGRSASKYRVDNVCLGDGVTVTAAWSPPPAPPPVWGGGRGSGTWFLCRLCAEAGHWADTEHRLDWEHNVRCIL